MVSEKDILSGPDFFVFLRLPPRCWNPVQSMVHDRNEHQQQGYGNRDGKSATERSPDNVVGGFQKSEQDGDTGHRRKTLGRPGLVTGVFGAEPEQADEQGTGGQRP